MKSLFILVAVLAVHFSCAFSGEGEGRAVEYATQSPTPVVDEAIERSYLENDNIVDRTGEIKAVFMGDLVYKSGKFVAGNDWAIGEDKDESLFRKGMTFDVMTCWGFVGKARLKKRNTGIDDDGYGWEMDFSPVNVPKANDDLLKKCGGDRDELRAFAVYPSKRDRDKVRITGMPTLQPIFDSIPARDKKWIASDDDGPGNRKSPDIEAWTDVNGDGQIDLIEVKGHCNGKTDGDLICMQVLHYSNNKWNRVGWLATD